MTERQDSDLQDSDLKGFTHLHRFWEKMPSEEEMLDLHILKAHLLAEESLARYLKMVLARPEAFIRAGNYGPRFSDLVNVAEAATKANPEDDWIWPALRKLNTLRNKYAHNLDDTKRERPELCKQLINECKNSSEWAAFRELYCSASYLEAALFMASNTLHNRVSRQGLVVSLLTPKDTEELSD
jgi:hypothetical protein